MFDIRNIINFFQNHNIPDNICDFCDLVENNFYDIFGENNFLTQCQMSLKEEYILKSGDKIFVNHIYDENYFIIQYVDNIIILQHDLRNVVGGYFDENNFLHYFENNEEFLFDKTFVIDCSMIKKFNIERKEHCLIINKCINNIAYEYFKNMSKYVFYDGGKFKNNFHHYFSKRNIGFKEIFMLQSLNDIFLKNGGIIQNDDILYKPLKDMEKYIKKDFNNWTEEELFYFKLKYC